MKNLLAIEPSSPDKSGRGHGLPMAIPVLCAITVISFALLAWTCRRGFGFVDEGFYLAVISNPKRFTYVLSWFGHVWHPLYVLAGGSVAWLRLYGAVALEICAVLFGISLANFLEPEAPGRKARIPIILTVTLGALWQFAWWRLPTPSYNQLDLCGLLLFGAGLLESVTGSRAPFRTQSIAKILLLITSGVTFTALAKPSTAVGAVLLGLVWLMAMPIRRRGNILLLTVLASALAYAGEMTLVAGSPENFVHVTRRTLAFQAMLDPNGLGNGLLSGFALPLDGDRPLRLVLAFGGFSLAVWAAYCWHGLIAAGRRAPFFFWSLALIGTILMGWARSSYAWLNHVTLHALTFLFIAMFCGIILRLCHITPGGRRVVLCNPAVRAGIMLLFLPLVYSFGTFAWIYMNLPGAAVFWCAALLALASATPRPCRHDAILITGHFCSLVTFGLIVGALFKPLFYNPSMWAQDRLITLETGNATLMVDERTHVYLRTIMDAARKRGFRSGMPLLDFSRNGPGAGFALGAAAPVTPFIGYGSQQLQGAVLAEVPATQGHDAWILADERDVLAMSALPWSLFGRRFPQDYALVARAGLPGFGVINTLWQPRNSAIPLH